MIINDVFPSGIHADGFWVSGIRVSHGCAGLRVPSLRSGDSMRGEVAPELLFLSERGVKSLDQVNAAVYP